MFIPGLEGAPLPSFQAASLAGRFNVVSLLPGFSVRKQLWDELVSAAAAELPAGRVVLLGESFGAALALRLAAALPDRVDHLVLLNPATSLARAPVARAIAALLPVLRLPGTYRLAAQLLSVLLSDRGNLHASVPLADEGASLFDVERVPLADVEARVRLLAAFPDDFGDECIAGLVTAPATLVASGKDRLLPSVEEARRLQRLLPAARPVQVLPDAPHAALLDSRVDLASILEDIAGSTDLPGPDGSRRAQNASTAADAAAFAEAARVGMDVFGPWRSLVSPSVSGRSHLTDAVSLARASGRPILFVGNHAKYGMFDLPLLYMELSETLGGRRVRALAHSSHFDQFDEISGGRWGRFVRALGGVPASPRAFYGLLAAGEPVLLFPGGAREVCRRRDEEYKLFWRDGTDFVRPAARFDAVIVPFSAVGADDDCETLVDGQEIQRVPGVGGVVQAILDRTGFDRELLMPIGGPPRLGRYYFRFHEAVDTSVVGAGDADVCREVYVHVKEVVQGGMDELLEEREQDPLRSFEERCRRYVAEKTESTLKETGASSPFCGLNLDSFLDL